MIIPARMHILSEHPNDKNMFYKIYEHRYLVRNYKRVWLRPTRNEDKSVSLTAFRKVGVKRVKYNDSKKKRPHLQREGTAGTAMTQQSPVPL